MGILYGNNYVHGLFTDRIELRSKEATVFTGVCHSVQMVWYRGVVCHRGSGIDGVWLKWGVVKRGVGEK